jgi:hypothetical protein
LSETSFQVLKLNAAGQVIARQGFEGFPPAYRGNGGIEMTVADLNRDGWKEIVVASEGNDRNHGDLRDSAPLNLISVIQPVVTDGQVTSFFYPAGNVLSLFPQSVNPSGALSIAAGELNRVSEDGWELVIGTGCLYEDLKSKPILPAPQSRYLIIKILYDQTGVHGYSTVQGPNIGYPAFYGVSNPPGGDVFVGVADVVK